MSTEKDANSGNYRSPIAQPSGPIEPAELVLNVPETAMIPDGCTFWEGEDDGRCRVLKPGGVRCRGIRRRDTGLCNGHSGIGGVATDPRTASLAAHAEKSRRAQTRAVLGITTRRAAQPLQQARVRAQLRANDFAEAIVDAPLDDANLSSVARQRAAIAAVELLYPQAEARLDVELPSSVDEVSGLGWSELQALAQQLLDA